MNHKTILAAATALALLAPAAGLAQDAMAGDAMAPMISDEELATCLEEAQAISFPEVAAVAEHACHALHEGEPMEGDSMMSGDSMESDSMEGDAREGDAMAPQ